MSGGGGKVSERRTTTSIRSQPPLDLIVGLGLGAAMVAARGAEKLVAPRLGKWGSFGAGLLAGVAVAAMIGLLVSYLLGLRGGDA